MRIDLHTHSSVSDGTDSPTELVAKPRPGGTRRGGADRSRHVRRSGRGRAAGDRLGDEVVPGWSCPAPGSGQSVHLLAYGADPGPPGAGRGDGRVQRRPARPAAPGAGQAGGAGGAGDGGGGAGPGRLEPVGGSPAHRRRAWSRPGHVRNRTEAFDRYLADGGPAHVPRYAIEIGRGIDLVHAAGGVAVIAHPWGRGRERLLPPEVLRAAGRRACLDGIEVDHQDHDATTRSRLRALADRARAC